MYSAARSESEKAIIEPSADGKGWLRRVGWFVLIWALSVGALAIVALVLRAILTAAGLRA